MKDLEKINFHEERRSGLSLCMVNVRIPIRYPSIDKEEAIGHTVWSFVKETWQNNCEIPQNSQGI